MTGKVLPFSAPVAHPTPAPIMDAAAREQIRTELVYYASAGRGRSKRHVVTLSKIPRIESIELKYRYPTYLCRLSPHC